MSGRRDRSLIVALGLLGMLVVVSVSAPLWWGPDPTATAPLDALQRPSWGHPMGTDEVGRDILARFLAGARISLAVGVAVALVAGLVGSLLGIVAAWSRGAVDTVMLRAFDIMLAFPSFVLAIAVAVAMGAGLLAACIGIVAVFVPFFGRIVRSDVLRILTSGYVESAVALGASSTRVAVRHVVPHVMPTILVQVGQAFTFSILQVAVLGFIGLGAQIPTPEWGTMIAQGSRFVITGEWWLSMFPGVGILLVTCAAMVATERVRSLLDPRSAARTLVS